MRGENIIDIILADAEIELVPLEMTGYQCAIMHAKKRKKKPQDTLLDSSVHYSALRKLYKDGNRRGRADIVHFFLLTVLDSIMNIEGKVNVWVHTRNNCIININSITRLPKNYNRFVALMEQLFATKRTPIKGEALLSLKENVALSDLLNEIKHGKKVIALSSNGKKVNLKKYMKSLSKDVIFIVGGFPHGDYLSPINELADEIISIYEKELKAWTVASEILVTARYIGW